MRVIIDDIMHSIKTNSTEYIVDGWYYFGKAIEIILDDVQQFNFYGDDTKRSFSVSREKINALSEYVKSVNGRIN